ncbi:MAG: hypothetical protein PVF27_07970 [Gemmatimonadales bacterium]|jgi:TolB protein
MPRPTSILGAVGLAWAVTAPGAWAQVARLDVLPESVEIQVGERTLVFAAAYDRRDNIVTVDYDWTSSNPNVAAVEVESQAPNEAWIVGASAGTANVQVRASGLSATVEVRVIGGAAVGPSGEGQAQVLQIDPTQVRLLPTEEIQLRAIFLKADGSLAAREPVTFQWLGAPVGAVDASGRVTAIRAGNGLVRVSSQSGLTRNVPVEIQSSEWTFERPVISLSPGEEDTIRVVVPSQQGRAVNPTLLSWQSTNPNAVVVSPVGVVTGISAGESQIVASGFGAQRRVPARVHPQVEFLDVLPPRDTVMVPLGAAVSFTAQPLAADETPVPEAPVIWEVADSSVATYDAADSAAVGQRAGTTELTVIGPSGLTKTWTLHVVPTGLVLNTGSFGMSPGRSRDLEASYADSNGVPLAPARDVNWSSSNTNVAQVGPDGGVTAESVGRAAIVASTEWGNADTAVVFVQGGILVTSTRTGDGDIYAFDPDALGQFHRITQDVGVERHPAYSYDGSRIAFTSNRDGNLELYVMDADGQNITRLTTTLAAESYPAWTPDGRHIVYQANAGEGDQIWIMDADGGNQRQLTVTGDNLWPTVSPDGSTIAFVSTRSGRYDVHLMNTDGGNQRNFTSSPETWEWHPSWLGDSTLAFVREERVGRAVSRVVTTMNFARETETLTDPNLLVSDFGISPDGTLLAIQVEGASPTGGASLRVYLIPLDGGTPSEVTRETETEQLVWPSFRP